MFQTDAVSNHIVSQQSQVSDVRIPHAALAYCSPIRTPVTPTHYYQSQY